MIWRQSHRGSDELRIELNPALKRLGVTLADVSRQVRQAYFGEEVQRLPRDGEDVRVMVRLPKSARTDLDSIDNLGSERRMAVSWR